MKLINNQNLKEIQLNILDKIDDFCKKNHLKYYLAYGTLLGAVRHKGFIPWDDDIDLFMPRKDYDCFVENFNNKNSAYRLFSINDKGYIYPFSKVVALNTTMVEKNMKTNILGVNVDIFPLDNLPSSPKKVKSFKKRILNLHYLQLIATRKFKKRSTFLKTIISALLYLPLSLFGYKRILEEIDRKSRKYSLTKCNCVANLLLDTYLKKESYNFEWFGEGQMLEFEGKLYPCPTNYHFVLTQIYGDYLKLPPENQRIKTHDNEAYWKEN